MSIRLRLALWYGMLFASILLMVALLSYALHVRGHYDDVDQALLTSAGHAGAMLTAGDAPSMAPWCRSTMPRGGPSRPLPRRPRSPMSIRAWCLPTLPAHPTAH